MKYRLTTSFGSTLLIILVGFALALITVSILPSSSQSQPANAAQNFDHSNCQYPDRWSNPADGCDNSDPAVPQCIKAIHTQEAEQACIAEYVKQYEQPAPSEPVTTTPASDEQINYSCGVK